MSDIEIDFPDLPDGWEWRGGNGGSGYYTLWFGTEFRMGGKLAGKHGLGGYDGQIYWDEPGGHHVEILPITSIRDDDPELGYAEVSRSYDSKQEAVNAVPELIAALEDDDD